MLELFILLSLIIIPATIHFFHIPAQFTGSDHAGYLSQVLTIKHNKHRLIHTIPNFMFNNQMVSPQLMTWSLSFLPEKILRKYAKYVPILFTVLSSLFFFAFTSKLYDIADIHLHSPRHTFLGICAAIYISTPYNYNFLNAKNVGLSARGLGLLLGQLFLYLNIFFIYTNNLWFFVLGSGIAFLIVISGKFALQFLLFSAVPLALLSQNASILLEPILGLLLFLTLSPRYAIRYIQYQISHKVFYSKYLAKHTLFKNRYSLWRDFVWDFWKILLEKNPAKRMKKGAIVYYFYENSLLISIYGFPFLLPLLLSCFSQEPIFMTTTGQTIENLLMIPILSSVVLFLATTFRAMRFLGEPERYLEFSSGLIAVEGWVLLHHYPSIMWPLIAIGGVIIIAQLFLYKKIVSTKQDDQWAQPIKEITRILAEKEKQGRDIRLMCNSTVYSRMIGTESQKILYGVPLNNRVGPFLFEDVYDHYPFVRQEMIVPLVRHFNINYLVMATMMKLYNTRRPADTKDLSFKEIFTHKDWCLFEVLKKDPDNVTS